MRRVLLVLLCGVWLVVVAALVLSMLPGVGTRLGGRWPGFPEAGYPQRIGFVRGAPALPGSPGALAAVVTDNNFGNTTYEVLDAAGRAWTVPSAVPPSLSPDGLLIASAPATMDEQRFVVQNVGDGRTITGEEIRYVAGDPGADDGPPAVADAALLAVADAALLDWSADSRFLLLALQGRGQPAAVLDVDTARLTTVAGRGAPAGFLPNGAVVRVQVTGPEDSPVVRVSSTVPGGSVGPPVVLRPDEPWDPPRGGLRWALSPTGELMVWDAAADGARRLRWFSTQDGVEGRSATAELDSICAVGWRGDDPVFSTKTELEQAEALALGTDGELESLVAIHHRMQSFCVAFARDALEAGPTRMLWGTWDATWTWYWRPLLLVVLLLGGLGVWLATRRRRARSSGSASDLSDHVGQVEAG